MKEKLIKFVVEKFWDCDEFQQEVVKKIKQDEVNFLWKHFNKLKSEVGEYIVLHDVDKTVPVVSVPEPVEVVDKPVETKPIKKRKYNKKKKAE